MTNDKHTALLIIDVQRDYFEGGRMELVGSRQAADALHPVLEDFRRSGRPVVHIQHIAVKPTATFFLPGTEGIEFDKAVKPLAGETVLVKHFPNSFRETGLQARLADLGVTHLVVAGMMTHMCVDTTVRAAFDLGFDVTVLAPGCATRNLSFGGRTAAAADVQTAYLAALNGTFARVVDRL